MTVPRSEWEWYGSPGHLIVAQDCRFHLATVVGPWLISTVGEYLPDEPSRRIHAEVRGITIEGKGDAARADFLNKCGYVEIGAGRKYETMVFPVGDTRCSGADCDCQMPEVTDWSEVDSDVYNIRGDAHRGHYAMCEKWAAEASS